MQLNKRNQTCDNYLIEFPNSFRQPIRSNGSDPPEAESFLANLADMRMFYGANGASQYPFHAMSLLIRLEDPNYYVEPLNIASSPFYGTLHLFLTEEVPSNAFFSSESVDQIVQALYQASANAATLLQAILTLVVATGYHDQLPLFDQTAPSMTLTMWKDTDLPLRRRGLIAVTVCPVTHLLFVCITTAQFLNWIRISSVRNAWQSIAHMITGRGGAGRYYWKDASLATDKNVKSLMKAEHDKKTLIGVRLASYRSGTEMVKYPERWGNSAEADQLLPIVNTFSVTGPNENVDDVPAAKRGSTVDYLSDDHELRRRGSSPLTAQPTNFMRPL